ncbi:MAG TPA: type III secretion protein [Ramlibacter sp.]|jgi:type III secretion protein O|uniref:type III secretion protein n=1 Tax=Ramlibacter sp. TaxID=1917967 RepID=UPI002D3C7606|nr:type III secretion protein [Ramlibacter sp.]HZY20515.1 type III secretion protein [Ramlibacter sp.]
MSVFGELLAIKSFRENKAELAVRKQRTVLADATARRDGAQQTLEAFRGFAQQREDDLYADLCTRVVRLREIEDVQLAVVSLRGEERRHEEALAQAQERRRQEAGALETCQVVHAEASRMKQKFMELAQVYADEHLRELERKEDAELEEVAETRRDRADWDEREDTAP